MGLVFPSNQQHLSVYFRRISTGGIAPTGLHTGGIIPAGLNDDSLAKTAKVVSELNYADPVDKEIIGSWYQIETVSHIIQFKA
jgi:hypothetical protein